MTYQELIKYLYAHRDEKFASFSKSLSNSTLETIGVKNPVLRELVKSHYDDSELRLSDFELQKYLEVDFLYFALALARRASIEEQLEFLLSNLKYASSWAITDTITTYLRKSDYETFYSFFKKTYNSSHSYTRRFAYVYALKFSKDRRALDLFKTFKDNEEYIVYMAEAWLVSFVALSFEDEVYEFLKECQYTPLVRKSISKICDSFRFSEESKKRFKSLRK